MARIRREAGTNDVPIAGGDAAERGVLSGETVRSGDENGKQNKMGAEHAENA
jgi:hypothetical protein